MRTADLRQRLFQCLAGRCDVSHLAAVLGDDFLAINMDLDIRKAIRLLQTENLCGSSVIADDILHGRRADQRRIA